MHWRDRISVDPAIGHGRPCIAGTRVMLSAVLDTVAVGVSWDEILKSYPMLSAGDIQESREYAAKLARERTIYERPPC